MPKKFFKTKTKSNRKSRKYQRGRKYVSVRLPWSTQLTVGEEYTTTVLDLGTRLRMCMESSEFVKAFQQYKLQSVLVKFVPSCYEGTWPSPLKSMWNDLRTNNVDPLVNGGKFIVSDKITTLMYKIKGRNNEMGVWHDITEEDPLSLRLALSTVIQQDSQTNLGKYFVTISFRIYLRHPVNKVLEGESAQVTMFDMVHGERRHSDGDLKLRKMNAIIMPQDKSLVKSKYQLPILTQH